MRTKTCITTDEITAIQPMVDRYEVSRWLGISITTLDSLIKKGEIPKPQAIGRQLRWTRQELATWQANRRATK